MHKASVNPRLVEQLKVLGATKYNLLLPETKAIPSVLEPDEKIIGLVYGRYKEQKNGSVSRGVLVATDQKVILLNKKFMYQQSDEIAYRVISGVNYSRVAFMGIVTLHSRVGDISVRTFNQRCASIFVAAIESKILSD